ncbi:MAG: hypothetical protein M1331_00875 [Candidatus Marsarchaeota archaeon]|nr:hypothetical protein [Candidatus Marsarchaeota archaeon]MCL5105938.1 hypothetical protein [Candidatus Marsarchaeota archaeon]
MGNTKILATTARQTKKTKEQMNECGFFFIEPQDNMDARQTAQKLLSINNIAEVFITEGDYGFIAKTNTSDEAALAYIADSISSRVSKSFKRLSSYYKMKK